MQGSIKLKHMYEHLKENGDLNRPPQAVSIGRRDNKEDLDIKAFQQRKQQAEMTR